jgi:hypothetical protein
VRRSLEGAQALIVDAAAVERALVVVCGRSTAHVRAALLTYGTEPHEREVDRVRMAIVKLVSEYGLDRLEEYVEIAKRDYRDVLMGAEYPGQAQAQVDLADDERERLAAADKQQYNDWLERVAG